MDNDDIHDINSVLGSAVTAGSAFAACQSIGATGSLAYLGGGAIIGPRFLLLLLLCQSLM